jgi:hypothetical protein
MQDATATLPSPFGGCFGWLKAIELRLQENLFPGDDKPWLLFEQDGGQGQMLQGDYFGSLLATKE